MSKFDPNQEIETKISLGHVVVMWEILSEKLSGTPIIDEFTEDEKRAIWALEDLYERTLVNKGCTQKSDDWAELLTKSREFIKTIPTDFLD